MSMNTTHYHTGGLPPGDGSADDALRTLAGEVQECFVGPWIGGTNTRKQSVMRTANPQIWLRAWAANLLEHTGPDGRRSSEALAPPDAPMLRSASGTPCVLGVYGDTIVDIRDSKIREQMAAELQGKCVRAATEAWARDMRVHSDNSNLYIATRSGMQLTQPLLSPPPNTTDAEWNSAMVNLIQLIAARGLDATFNVGAFGCYSMPGAASLIDSLPRSCRLMIEHIEGHLMSSGDRLLGLLKWLSGRRRAMHFVATVPPAYANAAAVETVWAVLACVLPEGHSHHIAVETQEGAKSWRTDLDMLVNSGPTRRAIQQLGRRESLSWPSRSNQRITATFTRLRSRRRITLDLSVQPVRYTLENV